MTDSLAAEPTSPQTSPALYRSATHLGFAVERSSTVGFAGAQGSAVMLDFGRYLDSDTVAGLTTVALGGERLGERYYRLGAGPSLSFAISENWQLGGALFYYSESGVGTAEQKTYRSNGGGIIVHWQRRTELVKGVSLAWGGFLAGQRGDFDRQTSQPGAINRNGVSINQSWTQGLRLSLLTDL